MTVAVDCKEKAHDKVRKAAYEGGWQWCPICEVARLSVIVLEATRLADEIEAEILRLNKKLVRMQSGEPTNQGG